MGTFTVTFSDVDGKIEIVDVPEKKVQRFGLGEVTLDVTEPAHIDPAASFYQTIALNFIHKPGSSICSMVVGGVLYKWC